MIDKKELVRDTTVFTIFRYLSYISIGISGLMVARLLGPELFGTFTALALILKYSKYSPLGISAAMIKKVPFYIGKKKIREANNIKNISFTSGILFASIISVATLIISIFTPDIPSHILNGLRIISIIILMQQIYMYFQTFLRIDKKFTNLALGNFLYAAVYLGTIILILIGITKGNAILAENRLETIFLTSLIAHLSVLIYLTIKGRFQIKLIFNAKKTWKLMRIGMPILLIGIMYTLLMSLDKIMIISFLESTKLGYYAIGVMIAEMIYFIPQSAGYITLPHLLEQYGKRSNKRQIKELFMTPTVGLFYIMPSIIGAAYILSPLVITYILPQYIPGLKAIKTIIFAIFFISVTVIVDNLFITLNKEKKMLKYQGISLVTAIILNLFFVYVGLDIFGVALATLLSYMLYGILILKTAFEQFFKNKMRMAIRIIKLYIPFAITIIFLLMTEMYEPGGNLIYDIKMTSVKIILFAVFCIPLYHIANRKTGIITILLSFIFKREKFIKK